jgi:hypothetical protein
MRHLKFKQMMGVTHIPIEQSLRSREFGKGFSDPGLDSMCEKQEINGSATLIRLRRELVLRDS